MAQRETLGLLYFEERASCAAEFTTPEIYLRMLAENVGLALANLKLRDTLHEMAMADPLTGLANRRRLEAVLDVELDEANRLRRPISCLMIDVDHFKTFNDRFGHEAGDTVLSAVGKVLTRATRSDGLAFRYGGEEFLLLLPGLGPEQALARAEQIRTHIAALRINHEGRELGPVTASVGAASAPAHCPTDRLVQAADSSLYSAKSLGRDRVEAAGSAKAPKAA